MIQGVPAKAVKAAADKVLFAAAQLKGLGALSGWGGAPVEPMVLFEGEPHEFRCEGDPMRRFVELGSLEVGAFLNKASAGGVGASPFARRVELGLLGVAMLGPAAWNIGRAVAGRAVGVVSGMARAVGTQARRWRK